MIQMKDKFGKTIQPGDTIAFSRIQDSRTSMLQVGKVVWVAPNCIKVKGVKEQSETWSAFTYYLCSPSKVIVLDAAVRLSQEFKPYAEVLEA